MAQVMIRPDATLEQVRPPLIELAGVEKVVGTVLLALIVILAPLRRAVRFKPGEALRDV